MFSKMLYFSINFSSLTQVASPSGLDRPSSGNHCSSNGKARPWCNSNGPKMKERPCFAWIKKYFYALHEFNNIIINTRCLCCCYCLHLGEAIQFAIRRNIAAKIKFRRLQMRGGWAISPKMASNWVPAALQGFGDLVIRNGETTPHRRAPEVLSSGLRPGG